MKILAFDPARKNLGVSLIRFDSSIEILLLEKFDIYDVTIILQTYRLTRAVFEILQKAGDVDIVLIEHQMIRNDKSRIISWQIASAVQTFYMPNNCIPIKIISGHLKNILPGRDLFPQGYYGNKKFSSYFLRRWVGDSFVLPDKIDDIADAFCMSVAYIYSKIELHSKKQNDSTKRISTSNSRHQRKPKVFPQIEGNTP
jgi:hypothetical protein